MEENMRGRHMDVLEHWRDAVVREGEKTYESEDFPNEVYDMSLTKTCLLQCHAAAEDGVDSAEANSPLTVRQRFCQQCHDYADARPNCWDCHREGSER